MVGILWFVVALLIILWLLGITVFSLSGFIHILLIVALIILVYNLFTMFAGRRSGPLL